MSISLPIQTWEKSAEEFGLYDSNHNVTISSSSPNYVLSDYKELSQPAIKRAIKCTLLALVCIGLITLNILSYVGVFPSASMSLGSQILKCIIIGVVGVCGLGVTMKAIITIKEIKQMRDSRDMKLMRIITELAELGPKKLPKDVLLRSKCHLLTDEIKSHEYNTLKAHIPAEPEKAIVVMARIIQHHREFAAKHPEYRA